MKIQDILFLIAFTFLFWKGDPRWLVIAGLVSIVVAIPLFITWIFFTAERLTWYAAAFFFLAILLQFIKIQRTKV